MSKTFIRDINPQIFFFEAPLYKKYYFEDIDEDKEALFNIIFCSSRFDWHCPKCEKEVPYKTEGNYEEHPTAKKEYGSKKSLYSFKDFNEVYGLNFYKSKRVINKYFRCLRSGDYDNHLINYWIWIVDDTIYKAGQNPALIEIEQYANRKYQNILKENYKDYNRAIGLYQHEIGIGSYVYLRRIFENLVLDDFKVYKETNNDISDERFQSLRMDEKIELLKNLLPKYLVQNSKIYSILSKGVHQLTEEECLGNFKTIRTGIELILNQKIKSREEERLIIQNETELADLKKKIT